MLPGYKTTLFYLQSQKQHSDGSHSMQINMKDNNTVFDIDPKESRQHMMKFDLVL